MTPPSPWWPAVRAQACRDDVDSPRMPLRIGQHQVGSVALPLWTLMTAAGLPLLRDGRIAGEAGPALAHIAEWLRAAGHAGHWRDELLAVMPTDDDTALTRVERGVVRNLGIRTLAVQLHARIEGSGHWWLQQRALDKATDPGLWDTVMGGMVSDGETVSQTLVREAWEEAGLRLAELPQPPSNAGSFTVRRPVSDAGAHGLQIETIHAFACTVAADFTPVNQDGEVLRFAVFDDAAIDALISGGKLTLEAAIAVALCRAAAD
ncbi:NUDIX domain-containing protein [Xylophilus sp. GOD-11R]|uniref:NUDIX domain-containing protein n=1 Tax=Xylophilus sp. GOD-11R TaxID=3089814 RepID=UPI00298CE1EC|nr:NUDIX domain-containing protein [Xylophilus sp. GOD-11R]WPB59025.1 NUDIX domain-containing protein [Xylophilus sp. GOD-11R]